MSANFSFKMYIKKIFFGIKKKRTNPGLVLGSGPGQDVWIRGLFFSSMTGYRISTETNFRKGTQVLKKDNTRNVKEKLKAQTSVNTVNKESKLNPNEMKKNKKSINTSYNYSEKFKEKNIINEPKVQNLDVKSKKTNIIP